jgi:hypothetical protein
MKPNEFDGKMKQVMGFSIFKWCISDDNPRWYTMLSGC